jgi:protein TonB
MTIVAGIHLAAFYFIAQGLGIVPPPTFTGSEVVLPIDEPQPQEAIPKIPVKFEESVPLVPRPVVDIDEPTDPPITADPSPVDPVSFEPTTGSAVIEAPGTSVMQDSRYPLTQPAYPPASKRDGEQGAAEVEVYVLPNGRVGDVRIARTTGYERLDRAAIQEARQSWRFKPATRAGEAVAQWYKVRVVFKLTEAR